MKSKTILGLIVIAIIVIGGIIILNSSNSLLPVVVSTPTMSGTPEATSVSGSPIVTATPVGGYTIADVAKHNNASSCWTTINGNVYDLTSWINQHPGGANAILSLCGIDGTQAFMNQHGGQARPEQELASLKIGALTQ